jgi:hypothetical protein
MPQSIAPLKPKQVVAALLKAGFYVHHQRGSHARLSASQQDRKARNRADPRPGPTAEFHQATDSEAGGP